MRAANLLALDEPDHVRLRRHITSRFSVRSVRSRTEEIAAIVAAAAARLRALGSPADVFQHFARPISVAVHALVLGIPDHRIDDFDRLFADPSTSQEKADFVRAVLDERRGDPGEDVVSDLLSSELTDAEIEGLVMVLMTSGRDSVAYMISTLTVALLTNPDQLDAVRRDPSLVPGAVEEIMRFGAMFVTLFPRTAVRDLELDGLAVRAGQTVSVSAAAANRDPSRFDEPDRFDVQRDSFGHLGFGHGSHGCVGQQLARREVAEAIGALMTGFPGLRLVSAEQLAPMPFAHPVATYEAGEVLVAWD
ncbi:cytochrome P450 [Microbacterium sp. RU33B]|uniref:cytochrome P450 n=1 Tax=Microbacterium sp. RU33B TaxID=1907390 RepID=UPI0035587B11